MDKYFGIRSQLKTGDIVLFSGTSLPSKIIRLVQKSKWSHVGIVIKLPGWDMLLLWESVGHPTVRDVNEHKLKSGVTTVVLSEKLIQYHGDVSVRQLNKPITKEMQTAIVDLRKELNGRSYERQLIDMLKSVIDNSMSWFKNEHDLSTLFCSELVAEVYQRMGLLPITKRSDEYTPKDFSNEKDLVLCGGYSLGPEIVVKVKK